jgi:hypothetical protein
LGKVFDSPIHFEAVSPNKRMLLKTPAVDPVYNWTARLGLPEFCQAPPLGKSQFRCKHTHLFEVHQVLYTGYQKTVYLVVYEGVRYVLKSDQEEGLRGFKRNTHSGAQSRQSFIMKEWQLAQQFGETNGFAKPVGYCFHSQHTWSLWPYYERGVFPAASSSPKALQRLKMALSLAQMHTCIAHLPTGQYYYIMDNKPKQYVVDRDWNVLLVDFDGLNLLSEGERLWEDRPCYRERNCLFPQSTDRSPESKKCVRPTSAAGKCYGADQASQIWNLGYALLSSIEDAAEIREQCLQGPIHRRPSGMQIVQMLQDQIRHLSSHVGV